MHYMLISGMQSKNRQQHTGRMHSSKNTFELREKTMLTYFIYINEKSRYTL